jgi:hypothetical protein
MDVLELDYILHNHKVTVIYDTDEKSERKGLYSYIIYANVWKEGTVLYATRLGEDITGIEQVLEDAALMVIVCTEIACKKRRPNRFSQKRMRKRQRKPNKKHLP